MLKHIRRNHHNLEKNITKVIKEEVCDKKTIEETYNLLEELKEEQKIRIVRDGRTRENRIWKARDI